ncbi:hypothetical protein Aple_097090 [Acrocarpospora pleiomorpha]|uniref:Transposase DDE domain-containing protein n=1 Tax=Acrocarpospora pleiomorpha TaxID=90975 RepID=A0A5M3Y0P5_9ACTN|nr:hypothetical protein Aple_097090 [Acrocarpospora pleiomorpha]
MAADKAYSSRGNRAYLRRRRIRAVIPEKTDKAANRSCLTRSIRLALKPVKLPDTLAASRAPAQAALTRIHRFCGYNAGCRPGSRRW